MGDDLDDSFSFVSEPVDKISIKESINSKGSKSSKEKLGNNIGKETKRKNPNSEEVEESSNQTKVNKRQKISQKLKEERSIASLGNLSKSTQEAQVEFLKKCQRASFPNRTDLEFEEHEITVKNVSEIFTPPHTPENFPALIKFLLPKWKKVLNKDSKNQTMQIKGSPLVLVLSPSAIRAVDVIRFLGEFNPLCRIGKLFAKHLKVEEQKKHLQESIMRIGVGTPNRIQKLIQEGALSIDLVQVIVLDLFVDQKERTILEIPEVRKDLFELLESNFLKGKAKICLY